MKRLIALGLVVGLLCPAIPAHASGSPVGILVMTEGSSSKWNKTIKKAVKEAQLDYPTRLFFGQGDNADELHDLQDDIRDLENDGAHTIIVIPLAVSSFTPVIRQWKYLLGVDVQPGFINNPLFPVEKHSTIRFMEPLNDSAAVIEILLDRIHELSNAPSHESVIVIAQGPADDADNQKWLATLRIIAQRIQQRGHFNSVEGLTLREDSATGVRSQALETLRQKVDAVNQAGNRALVVSLLLSPGGIENKIDLELRGHNYVFTSKTLLPDSRISDWIRSQAP